MKIIGMVVFSVIFTNLLPSGKTSLLIKNTIRLCVYLCILTPALNFFTLFSGENSTNVTEIFTDYFSETVIPADEFYIKYCSEKTIENAEEIIMKKVAEEHGITVEITLHASVDIRSFVIKIENGEIQARDCDNEALLQKICDDLEKEYSVAFEVIKGVNDEMEYS